MSHVTGDGVEVDLDHREPPAARGSGSRSALVVTALLVVLLVAAAIFAVQQLRQHRQLGAADQDRSDATNTAQQFALRMDNFDGANLSDYEKKVNALLTTRAKGEFKQSFPAFEKVYEQGKAVGKGTVLAAGVQDIDQDSATVLVIHDRLVKSSYGDQQQYLRWSVSLDKVGGVWKIDKFEDGS